MDFLQYKEFVVKQEKIINLNSQDFQNIYGYSGFIPKERNLMKKYICIPGEYVLERLEEEILNEKTRAYYIALQQLYPIPVLLQPFVSDYKRKLQRQFNVLFNTAKEIYANPQDKAKLVRKNFPKYYQKTPLYSILLLQIPPLFTPNFIRRVLKQLKRLNLRYFKRRINFLLILFAKLESIQINSIQYHNDSELLRRMFVDKQFLQEYIYLHVEIEQKKYHILKKGGDWNQISLPDYFHGFIITSVSFYQYVSSIWKTLSYHLTQFLELKVADLYHVQLENGELEILKNRKHRYKLIKEFPRPPKIMMEIFHDPEILLRNYPSKGKIKIEKLAPDRLRYTITEKVPLMKIILQYDLVWCFKGYVEEWWIENSNYIKEMTGFAVYEETPEGNCRYADILVDFSLDNQLKPFEDMIIPALESMGRKNIEQLMENIYQELLAQDSTLLRIPRDECKESI